MVPRAFRSRLIDNDSKLVSCADERVIKMFDLDKRGKLIQKFEGHRVSLLRP